ncbi:N-acetylneuraminate synthase family protein [Candidatus Magnetaquicoccus inordinatus]|uniref:N-acetylneuraminate synthase family protein n=1 Tax=Candidatus Magnetaquicoccus inordinatus TaxID=2496818 RepID=UPI00102C5AD6|nr:N-acetylneuraminate synthase family protein [Candidatus Magnetaquicoccus inordinatus]
MVTLGSRSIGDGAPCFITLEAGATHNGLASAKRLASLAASAGADAVKFQIFDPDRLVADKKQLFSYGILADRATGRVEQISEPLYDILQRRSMDTDSWRQLKNHCDSLGLLFFATVAFTEDVDLLVELGCQTVKIASADVNHFPLIRYAAASGLCIQLDTGNASIGEVEAAVDVVRSTGNERIIIHHCPSGYPARLDGINLNILPTLKQMFDYPIAFSDHTPGWEMDIAAVALGANMVEKTITEDRTTRSAEHQFSLEPPEMQLFVRTIRELEQAMGSSRRILHDVERQKHKAVRRSLFLRYARPAGHILTPEDIDFRRPGFGISPPETELLLGNRLRCDLPADTLLQWSHLEPPASN